MEKKELLATRVPTIFIYVEESFFALIENLIIDCEKTAPIINSGLVLSESNLELSVKTNS